MGQALGFKSSKQPYDKNTINSLLSLMRNLRFITDKQFIKVTQLVSTLTRIWTKVCLIPFRACYLSLHSCCSHRDFCITSLWSLKEACEEGRVGRLPQFTEEKAEDQRNEWFVKVNSPCTVKLGLESHLPTLSPVLFQYKLSAPAPQFWKNILNFGELTSEMQ